ncbi:hypothetical protein NDU88_009453 [Pleurodeles waltl]|uniref:Uncharacterized protein n=1 Tax=Pleurodeles waltl TaxID=8319 RepID=A0AAV7PVV6_PLEWA|nr:hypothetical protein NDU88_009453 [Pleurodeles waltl]
MICLRPHISYQLRTPRYVGRECQEGSALAMMWPAQLRAGNILISVHSAQEPQRPGGVCRVIGVGLPTVIFLKLVKMESSMCLPFNSLGDSEFGEVLDGIGRDRIGEDLNAVVGVAWEDAGPGVKRC